MEKNNKLGLQPRMNLDDFGKYIKKKYNAYHNVDNTELAKMVLKKHPEFNDYVTADNGMGLKKKDAGSQNSSSGFGDGSENLPEAYQQPNLNPNPFTQEAYKPLSAIEGEINAGSKQGNTYNDPQTEVAGQEPQQGDRSINPILEAQQTNKPLSYMVADENAKKKSNIVVQFAKDFGNSFMAAGRQSLASMAQGVEEQSKYIANAYPYVPALLGMQPKYIGEAIKDSRENIDRINKNLNDINIWRNKGAKGTDNLAGFLGAMIPFAGMVAGSIITKNPYVAVGMTGAFAEMGFGEGAQATENYEKTTGKKLSDDIKLGAELGYAAAYTLPIGEYLAKWMPKGVVSKVGDRILAKVFSQNPEVTGKFGQAVLEDFLKKSPTIGKKLVTDLAKASAGGVLSMESMNLSKKAVDEFVIGRHVSAKEWWNTAKSSAVSGVVFGMLTSPFATYAQTSANEVRRDKMGSLALAFDDAGHSVEILPEEKGKQRKGLTTDGKLVDVTPEMEQRAFIIPTDLFNKTLKSYRKTGVVKGDIEREAYSENVKSILKKVSSVDNSGKQVQDGSPIGGEAAPRLWTAKYGDSDVFILGKDKNGTNTVVDTHGQLHEGVADTELSNKTPVNSEYFYDAMMKGYDEIAAAKNARPKLPFPINNNDNYQTKVNSILNSEGKTDDEKMEEIKNFAKDSDLSPNDAGKVVDYAETYLQNQRLSGQTITPEADSEAIKEEQKKKDAEHGIGITIVVGQKFKINNHDVVVGKKSEDGLWNVTIDGKHQILSEQSIIYLINSGVDDQTRKNAQKKKDENTIKSGADYLDRSKLQLNNTGDLSENTKSEIEQGHQGLEEAIQAKDVTKVRKELKGLRNVWQKSFTEISHEKTGSVESPATNRENGFKMVNGEKIERQKQGIIKLGKETNLEFADNISEKGHLGVIEANDLQPSHVGNSRNPKHFIEEAQPKERTDKASDKASTAIASNLDPEKVADKTVNVYSGAPTVNDRGEVIQGNNRAVGLKKYYADYNGDPKGYKQFLINNAEKFGLNVDDIKKIKNPVLVNVLGVDDDRAIKLGQYNAADLETGGKQRISPKETAMKAGGKLENVVKILTQSEDDGAEETIRGLIRANGIEALKYIHHIGAINDTQYTNALDNGLIKKTAIEDLMGIMTHTLFKGGRADLDVLFEQLPYRVQNTLVKSGHLIKNLEQLIQDIITANSEFKNSGIDTVDSWSNQNSMFYGGSKTPMEQFGTTVIGMLKNFLAAKTEKELTLQIRKYRKLADGENGLFPVAGIGEKAAFEQAFNLPYYDTKTTTTSIGLSERPEDEKAIDGRGTGDAPERPSDSKSGITGERDERKTGDGNSGGRKTDKGEEKKRGKSRKQYSKKAFDGLNEEDRAKLKDVKERLRKKIGGQLNVGIDPETLGLAAEAVRLILKSGMRKFADYAATMLEMVGEAVRPHLKSFYEFARFDPDNKEFKDEMSSHDEVEKFDVDGIIFDDSEENSNLTENKNENNVGNKPRNTERNRENDTDGVHTDKNDVQPTGEQDRPGGRAGNGENTKSVSGDGKERQISIELQSLAGSSSITGKQSNNSIHNGEGIAGASSGSAGDPNPHGGNNSDAERSPLDGGKGITDVSKGNNSTPKRLTAGSSVIKLGDIANIRETLPTLYPSQQDDVLKAEQRFFTGAGDDKETGKGMLFTNGTGTGKTFVGLGIAKRFIARGKKDILFVVPSASKVNDWVNDGGKVGVKISPIISIKDKGNGAVVTTYANFYQNNSIRNREFDLVVYDESHKLGQNEAGDGTVYYEAHRQVANLPSTAKVKAQNELAHLAPKKPRELEQSNSDKFTALERDTALNKYKEEVEKFNSLVQDRALKIHNHTKVLFLSATPFAYHKSLQIGDGTLFDISESMKENQYEGGAYNMPVGFDKILVNELGYRMRYNKATIPESAVDVSLLERQFYEKQVSKGIISGRQLQVDKDYSRNFIKVNSDIANKINEGFKSFYSHNKDSDSFRDKYPILTERVSKKWNYLYLNQLMENIKAGKILDRINDHLKAGRKIVVFHSYNNSSPLHPFKFSVTELFSNKEMTDDNLRGQISAAEADIANFESDYPHLANLDLGELFNPRKTINDKFGDKVREFNGTVSKRNRSLALKDFNDDDSELKIITIQRQAGKEGISLHDITGKHQRVIIDLGLPTAPTDAIQSEGRIYRLGLKSNAIIEYIIVGTDFEKAAYANKIATRARTAENLAMGNMARNLEQSFIEGYQNADNNPAADENGTGGKEMDRQVLSTSDYDRAKTFYFARGKKTRNNKSAEGLDYYSTPEPVGLKMAEWLDLKPGQDALEPSAGHGAIGRWFPLNTNNTFIEPSYSLASQLGLNVKGDVKQGTFESHYIGNKYDGIAMNPPFGTRSKTAGEHIVKAFKHLRDGGRLVAIVPDGNSMDKRLNSFLYGTNDKGDVINKNAVLRAEYSLPVSTFERAGTKVKTKIIIIDKIDDDEAAKNVYTQKLDFSNLDNINDLFDTLENVNAPEKIITKNDNIEPNSKDALIDKPKSEDNKPVNSELLTYGVQKHSKTGEIMHMAFKNGYLGEDMYRSLKSEAVKLGGYFSRYSNKANGIKAGFVFKTEDDARKFIRDVTKNNLELNEDIKNYGKFDADETKKAYGTIEKRDEATDRTIKEAEAAGRLGGNNGEPINGGGNNRGRDAVLSGRLRPRTVLDGFKESGEVNFNGLKISSPQDVADLFAIHRSPYIEKAHAIFVKDGKAVGTVATTLNKQSSARFYPTDAIAAMYDKFNADGMYFIHNHPSGQVVPSAADIALTVHYHDKLMEKGVVLIGHVITDHIKFSYIDISGKPFTGNYTLITDLKDYINASVVQIPYSTEQPKLFSDRESIAGDDAQKKLADVGYALVNGNGVRGATVYMTSRLEIAAYDIFPKGASEQDIVNLAKIGLKNNLGSRLAIVYDGSYDFSYVNMPYETVDVINTKTKHSVAFNKDNNEHSNANNLTVLWENEEPYNNGSDPTKQTEDARNLYDNIEDKYFSETDWVKARSGVEAQKNQEAIKNAFNVATKNGDFKGVKSWKEADKAIQIYLDTKRDPDAKKEYYNGLSAQKRGLIDLSEHLTPAMKDIADKIRKRYDALGEYAVKHGIIMNILNDYVNRVWKRNGVSSSEFWSKFGTSTRHSQKRILGTILEGWAQGLELGVQGASNNLSILEKELANVVENKKLIAAGMSAKDGEGTPVFTTNPNMDGYLKIKHPGFKKWEWDGQLIKVGNEFDINGSGGNIPLSETFQDDIQDELKIAPYKKKGVFITSDGKVFRRKDIYAPAKIAKRLNNILGTSVLKGVPGIDQISKFNNEAKEILLSYSFFHHIAFTRAYILSSLTNGLKDLNPFKAYKKGLELQKVLHPDYELLVRNRLTTGEIQDWDETAFKHETISEKLLKKLRIGKVHLSDENIETLKALDKWQKDLLFKKYGAGLKVLSGIAELNKLRKRYPTANENDLAKLAAKITNDSFGGQHLKEKGRNPTIQHIFRLVGLAPDWTESRINTIISAFKAGKEGALYRRYWGRIAVRTAIATIIANSVMALFNDTDSKETYLQTLLRMYKIAFTHPTRLNWIGVDITPLYKLAKGSDYKPNREEYLNVLGQFDAPVKYITNPVQVTKNKASVVAKIVIESLLGENWQGKRFTTIPEITGFDDKGKYLRSAPDKPGHPGHRVGDNKGGKDRWHLTKWSPEEKGALHPSEVPSFVLAQIRSMFPIPFGNTVSYAMGDMDGFEALTHSVGFKTTSSAGLPNEIDQQFKEIAGKAKLFMLEYKDKLRHKESKKAAAMSKTPNFVKYSIIDTKAKEIKKLMKTYNKLIGIEKFKAAEKVGIQAEALKAGIVKDN